MKGTFEGHLMILCTMVLKKILFEVPFNIHMILKEFDAETLDYIPDRQSPYHFFSKDSSLINSPESLSASESSMSC